MESTKDLVSLSGCYFKADDYNLSCPLGQILREHSDDTIIELFAPDFEFIGAVWIARLYLKPLLNVRVYTRIEPDTTDKFTYWIY